MIGDRQGNAHSSVIPAEARIAPSAEPDPPLRRDDAARGAVRANRTAPVLTTSDLSKSYGSHTALDSLSIGVAPGERVALLGHNGAGKTTLMKLVLGLTRPTDGQIVVAGARPGTAAARTATAYLPEAVAFHRALTGREQLTLFARLAGQSNNTIAPLTKLPSTANRFCCL